MFYNIQYKHYSSKTNVERRFYIYTRQLRIDAKITFNEISHHSRDTCITELIAEFFLHSQNNFTRKYILNKNWNVTDIILSHLHIFIEMGTILFSLESHF